MIKLDGTVMTFEKRRNRKRRGLGYADYGSDIVCSGISSAVLTSINLIDKYTKDYQLTQDDKKGYLCFILNDFNNNENHISLIIVNLIEVLEQIESSYPKNLKITIKK